MELVETLKFETKLVEPWVEIIYYTLSSNTTATSKTFIVPKVIFLRNSDLFYLKAYNLPFFHAKFQSTVFSGLASAWFWNMVKSNEILLKNNPFQQFFMLKSFLFWLGLCFIGQIGHKWTLFDHPLEFLWIFWITLYKIWPKMMSDLTKKHDNL